MAELEFVVAHSGEDAAHLASVLSGPHVIIKPGGDILENLSRVRVMISDFDGTVIPGGSLWKRTDAHLPPQARQDIRDRFALYRKERAEDTLEFPISLTHHIEFAVRVYVESGFPRQQLHEIAESLEIRPGFQDLCQCMDGVGIVSIGFAETIRHLLKVAGIQAEVQATEVCFSPDGCMCQFENRRIIVDTTKGLAALEFILGQRPMPNYPELLVVGDTINDRSMMLPNSVCGLIVDPDGVVVKRGYDYITRMWPNLSFVLLHNTFEPLVEMVQTSRHT